MTRLILTRHGECPSNRERRFPLTDDEELTPEGHRQARDAARTIGRSFAPHLVISSPVTRARQTAEVIAAGLTVPVEIRAGLAERSFGNLRGQPYDCLETQAIRPKWFWRPGEGESFEDVCRRVVPVLEEICSAHPRGEIVIVTHGAVMAALFMHASGDAGEKYVEHPNGGMMLLEHAQGRFRRQAFNE